MMRGFEVDEMVAKHCKEEVMDDLRERVAIALAKRRFWNYDGSLPIPEDALYDSDAILALVDAEYRPLLVQAREALVEAKSALKIALPAVDEHGLNMDRHIVRKAIVGCDSAIAAALAVKERSTP